MSFDMFKEIIDNLPKSVKWLHPQGVGEPLLYPFFFEAVKYAKEKGLKVKFFTNGSLLDYDTVQKMKRFGVDNVVFSVDDMTEFSAQKSRPDLNFKILAGIEYACNLLGDSGVKTTVRICKTVDNASRIEEIRQYWMYFADIVAVSPEVIIFTPDRVHSQDFLT